ncbi:hypothetical protein NLG97_g7506 [Lecanicillium saksenae]|uniref:Uncharacterized protein n=1 Tax=Lecanicillium saksenae TaxID=468837 RepID=A0ACC1QMV3_9HYPO|nr:hypothetical protein NLG97_g7506 [Lecanicillium saksenae]
MAPQTRNQKQNDQQTSKNQKEKSGVSKNGDSSKTKSLEKNLNAAADAYDKASDSKKEEMQNQLHVHEPKEKPAAMDEDTEKPADTRNVKEEPSEGDMFVSQPKEEQNHVPKTSGNGDADQESDSRPSDEDNHGKIVPRKVGFENGLPSPPRDYDDPLDLVRANPLRELFHGGGSENLGWVSLAFGRAFDVERQGPPNAARFRFKQHGDVSEGEEDGNLDEKSCGSKKRLGRKIYQCGDIVAIQGVVWDSLKGFDHYSSLAPRNWKVGERLARPPMRILVKWNEKVRKGEKPQQITRWEKREAVLKCWQSDEGRGNCTVKCEDELKLGQAVICEKGESMLLCDFKIVEAACRGEKRFEEWEKQQRPGRDRSPTPGLPLRGETPN